MTNASPIGMPDDFVVVCEDPSGAGMFVPALEALAGSLSQRSTVALVKWRRSRTILVGGNAGDRLRILLGRRMRSGNHHVRLTREDTLMWWRHDGQEWSVRAAMPDGHAIPAASASLALAERTIALTTAAMTRLTDPEQRARGEAVTASLHAWAAAAATQLPEGSRVACPAPPGPLGPETRSRALTGRKHDHVSSPTLDELVARSVPPGLHVWINHVWNASGEPAHHVTISGAFGVAGCPEDPMARLRAMSSIPDGETWAVAA